MHHRHPLERSRSERLMTVLRQYVHTVVRSSRRQQQGAEQSQGEVVLLPEHLQLRFDTSEDESLVVLEPASQQR